MVTNNIVSSNPVLSKAGSLMLAVYIVAMSFAGVTAMPSIAKALTPPPTDLYISCDSVSIDGNVWTFSGTWHAYDYQGQDDQYDVAVFSPTDVVADSESKDAPDTFATTSQSKTLYGNAHNDDMAGTWSNQVDFGLTTPTEVFATLYHQTIPGNESSGDAVCEFTLPPQSGGLTVIKTVVNDGGGTSVAGSFTIHVKDGSNADVTGSPFAGSTTGTELSLAGGSYIVSEPANLHYSSSFSGDCDSSGNVTVSNGATSTCTVTNTYSNALPTPNNSSVVTDEDTATSSVVTGNDTNGDSLTFAVVLGPTNGILSSFNGNTGAFTYTPGANYNGSDSFTFTVADLIGNGLTNGTVSITVNPINDNPVAEDDSANVAEDSSENTITVLGNDTTSPDTGETLTVTGTTQGDFGTTTTDGVNVKYTPNADYVGSDSFTYTISDGNGGTDTATANVTVGGTNDAPVANSDTASTNEDTATTTVNVLTNDTDADNDTLGVCGADATSVMGGTVVNHNDGTFTYTPAANFNGTDSFQYFVCDGNESGDTGTVTITVNSVNDAPVSTGQSIITDQNNATSSVLNATDVDLDSLTFATTSSPTNGTLSFFNSGTGQFTYTPALNYNGPDSFTFKANDGSVDSNESTVSIMVNELSENTPALCSDGIDNDNDSDIDLADADCAEFIPTLTIVKNTIGGDGTFTFNVQGMDGDVEISTEEGNGSETVTLDIDGSSYVSENQNDAWDFTSLECSIDSVLESDASIDHDGSFAGFNNLIAGDDVTCTFVNTIIPTNADVSIVKTVDDNGVNVGQLFTYTLTVYNDGPSTATNVVVTDVLPNSVTYVSDTGAGAYSTTTGTWTVGTLASGNNAVLSITVTANQGADQTMFANQASVDADNGDTNTSNNSSSVSVVVGTQSGGGGGGGGGGNGPISGIVPSNGQVLGASTSLPELPAGCSALLNSYMRQYKKKNDRSEVIKLQTFLNTYMQAGLPVTGFFGPMTDKAVRSFQTKHTDQVLTPWKLNASTGFVYLTTQRWVNLINCDTLNIPVPVLVPFQGE